MMYLEGSATVLWSVDGSPRADRPDGMCLHHLDGITCSVFIKGGLCWLMHSLLAPSIQGYCVVTSHTPDSTVCFYMHWLVQRMHFGRYDSQSMVSVIDQISVPPCTHMFLCYVDDHPPTSTAAALLQIPTHTVQASQSW